MSLEGHLEQFQKAYQDAFLIGLSMSSWNIVIHWKYRYRVVPCTTNMNYHCSKGVACLRELSRETELI